MKLEHETDFQWFSFYGILHRLDSLSFDQELWLSSFLFYFFLQLFLADSSEIGTSLK